MAAVIGAGTMGTGITCSLIQAGFDVVLVDVSPDALERAQVRLAEMLSRRDIRQVPPSRPGSVRTSTALAEIAESMLVVEAIPEQLELKRHLLAGIERLVSASAVIATNTSSLPIARIGNGMRFRRRLVGLHFFNPVPASQLVEVVRAADTDDRTMAFARSLVQRLGKVSIEVADTPGFATSRLGVLVGIEAIRMVEARVATPDDIDRGMVLGYRHPVGPIRLTDLVGLDVRLQIANHLADALGPRFAAPALLREMVAEGRLGRKVGRGFYEWSRGE